MSSGIMDSNNNIESALTNLIELSSKKGFLVFDDIYDVADKWNLSIKDIDYLSSSIATRGILVYDEAPVIDTADTSFDDYDDYAHRDYDAIFDKVIELDPGLEDFITAIRVPHSGFTHSIYFPYGPVLYTISEPHLSHFSSQISDSVVVVSAPSFIAFSDIAVLQSGYPEQPRNCVPFLLVLTSIGLPQFGHFTFVSIFTFSPAAITWLTFSINGP